MFVRFELMHADFTLALFFQPSAIGHVAAVDLAAPDSLFNFDSDDDDDDEENMEFGTPPDSPITNIPER